MHKPGALPRSWSLFRASLHVLRAHPKLVLFPLLALGSFFGGLMPFLLMFRLMRVIAPESAQAGLVIILLPVALLLPFVGYLMTSLMSGAFYHECVRALAGEPVSLWRGFRAALSRIRSIVVWHLFSFLATYLTRLVGGQFGLGGKIAEAMVGLGWGVASFFVGPIIMREPKGLPDPIGLVRKSTALLRATWGESVVGFVGMSLLSAPIWIIVVTVALLARGALGADLAAYFSRDLFLSAAGLAVIAAVLLWAVLVGLAGGVYRCALYIYATEGVVPEPFDRAAMDASWKVKKAPAA